MSYTAQRFSSKSYSSLFVYLCYTLNREKGSLSSPCLTINYTWFNEELFKVKWTVKSIQWEGINVTEVKKIWASWMEKVAWSAEERGISSASVLPLIWRENFPIIVAVCLFLITKRRSETVKCKITHIVALKSQQRQEKACLCPSPCCPALFQLLGVTSSQQSISHSLPQSLLTALEFLLPALLVKLWLLLLYAHSLPLHTSLGICYLSDDSPYFSIRYFSQKL